MKKLTFIIALFLLGSCACQDNKTSKETNDVKLINPLEITENVTDLSSYIESATVIPIDKMNPDKFYDLSNIKKMLVLDNGDIVTLFKENVYRFDKTGKLAASYGARGRGHGEYNDIVDICLNTDNTELLVLEDRGGKILKYNLSDGKFIGNIQLQGKINYLDGIIPAEDGGVNILTRSELGAMDVNLDFPYLTTYDKDGNLSRVELTQKDYDTQGNASFTYFMGKYVGGFQENDNICYMFDKGKKQALCKIHLGDENVEPLVFFDGTNNPAINFMGKIHDNPEKHKLTRNIRLFGDNYIYLEVTTYLKYNVGYLINRDKMSGINWEMGPRPATRIMGTDDQYIYIGYMHLEANKTAENQPLTSYISDLVGDAEEGDVILFKVKMKEF